jgi:hypothetical protein
MQYRPVLAAAALVALVGCSDDNGDSGATAASTPVTDAVAATSAVATTAAATTPATAAVPEQVAEAQRLAGTYTGEWTNTTFWSVGTLQAEVTVDAEAATATISLDVGGNAFGSPDPALVITEIDLTQSGPISGTNDLLGDFTVSLDTAGHLTFVAAAVPGVGGKEMTIEADLADGMFTGTYTITGLAEGTFTATRS